MTIQVLDLFAGAGGFVLGLEAMRDANGDKVFELYRAVEIDKYACETLRQNFGRDKVIEGDLTSRKIHKRVIGECKGNIQIVAGGIPCQSFSLIGPRSGFGKKMEKFKRDRRDHLYKEFRNIVKDLTPNLIIIENVKGILSKKDSRGRKIIDRMIKDFERLGYNFKNIKDKKKYMVLNAADFGVPQFRERVILVGIKKTWKNVAIPFIEPTHYNPKEVDSDGAEKEELLPYVTLGEAIGDLPRVFPRVTYTDLSNAETEKIKVENSRVYSGEDKIPFKKRVFDNHVSGISIGGQKYFEFVRPNGHPFTHHHIARSQQKSDIMLFSAMKQGETAKEYIDRVSGCKKRLIKYNMDTFKDKYRRQKWNVPCTTVFAHLEKDGNRFIHPRQARTITPREAARIQSFPDDFIFSGPVSKKFSQIGNAVPPLLAYNIGLKIFEIMRGE